MDMLEYGIDLLPTLTDEALQAAVATNNKKSVFVKLARKELKRRRSKQAKEESEVLQSTKDELERRRNQPSTETNGQDN